MSLSKIFDGISFEKYRLHIIVLIVLMYLVMLLLLVSLFISVVTLLMTIERSASNIDFVLLNNYSFEILKFLNEVPCLFFCYTSQPILASRNDNVPTAFFQE